MTENTASSLSEPLHERAFHMLSGDDSDERACAAIPEASCTSVPANYLLNVANGAATKLAEQIVNPGLVLPWLMTAIGAPSVFATLFVPIKQIGSLLPQLAMAGQIRRMARRKFVWAGAGFTQAAALVLLAIGVLLLPPIAGGLAAVVLFAIFCVASGAGSVAFQDVVGKTIPKGARGRMLSNRALFGGMLALAAAIALRGIDTVSDGGLTMIVGLVFVAAALWAFGAMLFLAMREEPGATEGGRSILKELAGGIDLMREIAGFRRYIYVRALLLAIELAMPVFVLQAKAQGAAQATDLPVYVIAIAVAAIVSSPFWGRFVDTASERVMALSGLIGAAAGVGMLVLPFVLPDAATAWMFAIFFALLGIAEAGIRLGRKTYLVDGAPQDERPLYTAFSNTVIGVLAFAGFAFGVVAELLSPGAAIILVIALSLAGAFVARTLPPAERMVS